MTIEKKRIDGVISNGTLVIIGFVFNKAINFLMIPILTRILTTSDYGKVSTYAAWVALLAYIIGMSLEYSVRNAYVDYKNDMPAYMSAICGLSMVGAVIIGSLIFVINKTIVHQMSDVLCICCIIHSYVHALVNYMNMKYTMYEQYKKRVLILVLPNLISSILGVLLIVGMTEDKYMGRIWGYILVFVPLGLLILSTQILRGKCVFRKKYWKYALLISLPMVAHGLSNVILSNFDRILLSSLRSDSEAGIYSLVYNFSMIAIAVTYAAENIWIPWFTKKMESGTTDIINKVAKVYIYFVVVLICGILLVAPEILMLMSAREYWDGKIIIAPIVLSSFVWFLYSLPLAVELYYKINRLVALNTFIAAILNLVLDWILIPYYGIFGAAYTTLVSYFVSFLMHHMYSRKVNRYLFPFKIYVLPLIIVVLMTIVSYVFLEVWIVRWSFAVLLGIICIIGLIKRETILQYYQKSND